MRSHNRKSLITVIILALALSTGGATLAGPAAQRPTKPMTPEERRKAIERLMKEVETKKEQAKAPGEESPQSEVKPATVPNIVERAPLGSDQIQLTFDNAELYSFINNIADTLGITPIIIDPEVQGSVTIHSSAPMSREEVFPLFGLILKNNNAALVKQGEIYQIVPISSALRKGLELVEHLPPPPPERPEPEKKAEETPPGPPVPPPEPPPPDAAAAPLARPSPAPQQVQPESAPDVEQQPETPEIPRLETNVIRVEFVPVSDLIEPIKLFMTEGGVIMPYERLNMLIVTDYSDSVGKVLEIIRLLDSAYLDPEYIELVEIKYNASADVAEDLGKIFGSGADGGNSGIYFISLDRLNAIFVMANSKRALEEMKRWIDRLDATIGRSMKTYVYRVENSTASNIAMILSLLLGGEGPGTAGAGGTAPGGVSGRSGTTTGQQTGAGGGGVSTPFGNVGGGTGAFGSSSFGQQGFGQQGYMGGMGGGYGGGFGGGSFGGGFFGAGQQLGPRLSQGPGMSAQILRGGVFAGLQDIVRVVADDINNSLIIQASPADYAYIEEIIKEMDVLPRQVIIDARIFEVDLTDALSFGISAELQGRTGEDRLTTGSMSGETGALSANTFAFVGSQRELLAALSALRAKTNVRVLEAPSVLALDGTAAKIVVGGEVPYPGASFIAPAGGSTTSIQYRETGVALIIMPRISASGTVTLEIAHELSAPGAPTNDGPTFNKTSVSTTLAVKDGETVAIAGLIRESDTSSRSGIPYLSDIPLVGYVFGKTSKSSTRQELLIMITPHVIRTPEKFSELTQELKDSLRHVRRFVDAKEDEHLKDLRDARREREQREQGKKEEPAKPEEPTPDKPKPDKPIPPSTGKSGDRR